VRETYDDEICDDSGMRRAATLSSSLLLSVGCFNPEAPVGEALETDTEGVDSMGSTSSTNPTAGPSTSSSTTGAETTDTDDETGDPTTQGSDPVCGDGTVEGAEVCDDGVNDGSYGGCADDCSEFGPSCGDGEVTDGETCDDEVNDGSYGGCTDECAFAAFCGDGVLDGDDELCDEGDDNENGLGCNVDCTTSGTVVEQSMQTGLTFCDGAFATPTQFTPAGNGLVAASGYCGGDSQLLQEFSPSLEVVQTFDVLMPDTPVRNATIVGDRWVLSASSCNYAVASDGTFAEACGGERITGQASLESVGKLGYAALDYGNQLGLFDPASPTADDTPTWTAQPPAPAFYVYSWYAVAAGPNDSVLVAGRREREDNGDLEALMVQYTAAGNVVDTNTFAAVSRFTEIATGPGGTPLVYSSIDFGDPGYPGGVLTQFNAALDVAWNQPVTDPGQVQLAVDSTGAPIVLLEDGNGNGAYELRKLDRTDGSTLWSVGLPNANNDTRIAVGPDDYIWVSSAGYGPMGGQLWVGRVSP